MSELWGQDQRVAGLDDHTSWCKECGDLMLRQDVDLLEPYSKEKAKPEWWLPELSSFIEP